LEPLPFPATLDHIAVAVPDLDAALPLYLRLEGGMPGEIEEVPSQGVRVTFVGVIELLAPTAPDTPVGRFLERRGPGLHHVAWRVDDIRGALAALEAEGYELIDRTPRPGARGHQVAFLHPRSTHGALIELVQAGEHG